MYIGRKPPPAAFLANTPVACVLIFTAPVDHYPWLTLIPWSWWVSPMLMKLLCTSSDWNSNRQQCLTYHQVSSSNVSLITSPLFIWTNNLDFHTWSTLPLYIPRKQLLLQNAMHQDYASVASSRLTLPCTWPKHPIRPFTSFLLSSPTPTWQTLMWAAINSSGTTRILGLGSPFIGLRPALQALTSALTMFCLYLYLTHSSHACHWVEGISVVMI